MRLESPASTPLPRCSGIYEIVDSKSGRRYVGSAKDLCARFHFHIYQLKRGKHHNPIIQRIFAKDPARLSFFVLKEMPAAGKAELLAEEQALLDGLNVGDNPQCMNIVPKAGSHLGAKRSEESRKRLSEALKGRVFSAETREKMRRAKLGTKRPAEERARRSEAQRGKPCRRPEGIINHTLRQWSPTQVGELRELRRGGASWRVVARAANTSNVGAVRRAVLGITYKDVEVAPCD